MVKDHEEKIRVLTKPLKTSGEKTLSAVQFSNTTGKRAARLRLLKTVSTVTAAHDEQQRIWKICMSCMSSPIASVLMLHTKDSLGISTESTGKMGSVKNVWESMSRIPVLCCSGEKLQTLPVHLEQLWHCTTP